MVDIAGQLSDIRAAIDAVRSNPRLDASRIILWGTSLGGGHVVTAAADREDVVAVVAQVPFNGFPRKVEGRSTMTAVRVFVAMVRDRLRGAFRKPPAYIPLVGPAESLAVMASDSAWLAIAGLDSPTWRNEVAPRGLFAMMRYHPADDAPRVRAPLLVCAASADREAPVSLVRELTERAPRGRQIGYNVSHLEVYRPDARARILTDRVAFLREVV